MKDFHLPINMLYAQDVETSVTNNSSFKDDQAPPTTDTPGLHHYLRIPYTCRCELGRMQKKKKKIRSEKRWAQFCLPEWLALEMLLVSFPKSNMTKYEFMIV